MRDLCDDVARLGRGEILREEPSEEALDCGVPMERQCQVPSTVAQRVDAPPKRREWVPEIQPVIIQAKPTPEPILPVTLIPLAFLECHLEQMGMQILEKALKERPCPGGKE